MPHRHFIQGLIAALIILTWAPKNHAQSSEAGAITGAVTNRETSNRLAGAVVEIAELERRAVTDGSGQFSFRDLPPGRYTLRVSYTGLMTASDEVTVNAGQILQRDILLAPDVHIMGAFSVYGEREGNAASITSQKNALNVVNVVAMDAYGNVAEGNLGNFLKRLPGVATLSQVGDITGIVVRGAPPSWNSVAVDGTRAASANASGEAGMGRGAVVDQIPPEFIKEIELIKAPTPDMPADSIGGAANLVTKSGFDISGNRTTYSLAGNVNTYRRKDRNVRPAGSITYLGKIGESRPVALALSGSYTEMNNTRDRVQMTRNTQEGFTTQARTLDDDILRTRAGLSGKLEFRPMEHTRLNLNAQYSYYQYDHLRTDLNISAAAGIADYNVVSRAAIEAGATSRTTSGAAAGIAPTPSVEASELLNANFTNTQGRETRDATTYKLALGGETEPGDRKKLTYSAAYSRSTYDFLYSRMAVARNGGIGMLVDSRADPRRPEYRQTFGPNISAGSDWSSVTNAAMQQNFRYSEDEITQLAGNFSQGFEIDGYTLEAKAGGDFLRQYHSFDTFAPRWTYNGPTGGASARDLSSFILPGPGYGVFNNRYPRRDRLDFNRFEGLFASSPSQFSAQGTSVSNGTTYNNATEDVWAGYVMGTLTVRRLTALGGVRYEDTDVTAAGRMTDPRNSGVTRVARSGRYDQWFPSLHLKYQPTQGFIIRGAVSKSIARPAHDDLYPNTTISYDAATGLGLVQQNNPALGPQLSTNYDVSAEYYFEPVGVISAGYFEKDIRDFIGREDQTIGSGSGNGFGGDYAGFILRTTRNFGSATIKGWELNYQQRLSMLPGVLKGLSVLRTIPASRPQGSTPTAAWMNWSDSSRPWPTPESSSILVGSTFRPSTTTKVVRCSRSTRTHFNASARPIPARGISTSAAGSRQK